MEQRSIRIPGRSAGRPDGRSYTSPLGEYVISLTADSPHQAWMVVRVTDIDGPRIVKRKLTFDPAQVSAILGMVELAPSLPEPELSAFGDPGSRTF